MTRKTGLAAFLSLFVGCGGGLDGQVLSGDGETRGCDAALLQRETGWPYDTLAMRWVDHAYLGAIDLGDGLSRHSLGTIYVLGEKANDNGGIDPEDQRGDATEIRDFVCGGKDGCVEGGTLVATRLLNTGNTSTWVGTGDAAKRLSAMFDVCSR